MFVCALLNAQPLGFYAPAQLIAEAKCRGIKILPIDINYSDWDSQLTISPHQPTRYHAVRLGLRLVKGLSRYEGEHIVASRDTAFETLDEIMKYTDVSVQALQAIAEADGCASLNLSRRQALWHVSRLKRYRHDELPLFAQENSDRNSTTHIVKEGGSVIKTLHSYKTKHGQEPFIALPMAGLGSEVFEDYRSHGLSLKAHPLDLVAKPLLQAGWHLCSAIHEHDNGQRLRLAGLVTMRQRPGTANGTVFLTIEDGQGNVNVIVWSKLTVTYRKAFLRSQIIGVVGHVQQAQSVTHFIAESLFNLNGFLRYIENENSERDNYNLIKSRNFK